MCKITANYTMHIVGMFEAYHMTALSHAQLYNTAHMQADTFESDTIVRYTHFAHDLGTSFVC